MMTERKIALLGVLVLMGMVVWFLGTSGGSALPMAVGLVFGVLASLPGAILALQRNTSRRCWDDEDDYSPRAERRPLRPLGCEDAPRQLPAPQMPYQQPPVVVILAAVQPQEQPQGVRVVRVERPQLVERTRGGAR